MWLFKRFYSEFIHVIIHFKIYSFDSWQDSVEFIFSSSSSLVSMLSSSSSSSLRIPDITSSIVSCASRTIASYLVRIESEKQWNKELYLNLPRFNFRISSFDIVNISSVICSWIAVVSRLYFKASNFQRLKSGSIIEWCEKTVTTLFIRSSPSSDHYF